MVLTLLIYVSLLSLRALMKQLRISSFSCHTFLPEAIPRLPALLQVFDHNLLSYHRHSFFRVWCLDPSSLQGFFFFSYFWSSSDNQQPGSCGNTVSYYLLWLDTFVSEEADDLLHFCDCPRTWFVDVTFQERTYKRQTSWLRNSCRASYPLMVVMKILLHVCEGGFQYEA